MKCIKLLIKFTKPLKLPSTIISLINFIYCEKLDTFIVHLTYLQMINLSDNFN